MRVFPGGEDVSVRSHVLRTHDTVYGVALVSRIDDIIGLFCKRGL